MRNSHLLIFVGAVVVALPGCPNREPLLELSPLTPTFSSLRERASSRLEAEKRKPPPELPWTAEDDAFPPTLEGQREQVLRKLRERLKVPPEAIDELRKIFFSSRRLGQGNPKVTEHPMTRAACRALRKKTKTSPVSKICQAPHMVALYNPAKGQSEKDSTVCIDQFEFPNIPCEYPITWVQAHKAQLICKALGKRLCDAHEWEGACYGELRPAEDEYAWKLERENSSGTHNMNNVKNKEVRWAYGPKKNHAKCGTSSRKSDKCVASEWERCGSNTYPAGAFPECVSPFGVYDQHGNAAEHMSLPMKAEELGSRGGIGSTEMKGSWFIFNSYEAHKDDCRWRAPDWHGSRVMDGNSHGNYHLGFRCCKDISR